MHNIQCTITLDSNLPNMGFTIPMSYFISEYAVTTMEKKHNFTKWINIAQKTSHTKCQMDYLNPTKNNHFISFKFSYTNL